MCNLQRCWVALLATAALLVFQPSAHPSEQETPALFPFVLPWDDATPGPTDLSSWLHQPAGKFGHLRIGEDGRFYAGPDRIRFLGVNMSFGGNFPAKPDAEKIAARLAKFGVNVVRFHHMDTGVFPNGIRARGAKDTGQLDPEALDRMSYFIEQLKQRGIYANLNLLVGRPFNAADGRPPEIEQLNWKERHIIGFFDPAQLDLEKEFARRLLTHRNSYSGLTFAEDPAVAFVEINNEQGLIHAWLGGHVDQLPEVFKTTLTTQWNQWLQQRYSSTEKLRAAWSAGEQPLAEELLSNRDFSRQLSGWNLERHSGASATVSVSDELPEALRAVSPESKAVKIEVAQPGQQSWHVQFNQSALRLQAGRAYTVSFWAKADAARSIAVAVSQAHEPWENLGLSANAALTPEWREFRFNFNATQTNDRSRISFSNLGGSGAACELAGISVRPGGVFGLREGERLENGTLRHFERKQFGERTPAAQRDWIRFLGETEDRYWQAMQRFLKEDLKVRGLVAGTIVGCSPPNLMARLDWIDTHAYWQHPHFPGRPWDPGNWIVQNRTMVNERGGTLPGLALKRVVGKPHAVTEYNHAAPNTYSSEAFLLLAAYGALQDWDAIYVYSYAHSRNEGWGTRRINSFFDIDQHPTKMATLIAAAGMFVRGDVRPAHKQVVAELNLERETDLLRNARAWSLVDAGHAGLAREAALVHRVALATEGLVAPRDSFRPESMIPSGNRFVSDTGELVWDLSESGRGVVTLNAARSKAVIGYGGGKRFDLGGFVVEPGEGMQNGWGAITLTRVGEGNSPAAHWVITATGYADNEGMQWKNAEKSTVGRDWGQGPSRVEGVPARISMRHAAERVQVWALDERGQRKQPVKVERGGGNTVFVLGPESKTLWYEVEVK
jgi:hypothetical protein